jgi:hypothetical protein
MGAKTSKKCDIKDAKGDGILALSGDRRPKSFLQNVKLRCEEDFIPANVKAIMGIDQAQFYQVDVKYDLAVIIPTAVAVALFLILVLMLAARRRAGLKE